MVEAIWSLVAGLVGLLLGRFWDARSESGRWRRDLRVRSYEAVAVEFFALRATIREVSISSRDPAGFRALTEQLWRRHADWNARLTTLWLHGSEAAARAATES